MNQISHHAERIFERVTSFSITVMGNSLTFIIACCSVIFWLTQKDFFEQSLHECIHEAIIGITFLSLFLIQKSFNRFSASLHLKVNELVSSHEPASNAVIDTELKTERELTKLSKEYIEITDTIKNTPQP